jgi:3-dehydroquinate synthase
VIDGISINSKIGNYEINLNSKIETLKFSEQVSIIDSFFQDSFKSSKTFSINSNEGNKNLMTVENIIKFFKSQGVVRDDKIMAIGGGFIQDISTLATSLYMRGIGWIFIPTTLTAMIDSCIGGKSSLNVGSQKNLIGNFWPPIKIEIDPKFLETLPMEDKIAGLAEASKICFARNAETFTEFLDNPSNLDPQDNDETLNLINLSLLAKKWFIEIDEFDIKERKLLNFGHTFGHALESATNFKINHGVAVAIGMLAESIHPNSGNSKINTFLIEYLTKLLAPIRNYIEKGLADIDWEEFDRQIVSDKKNTNSEFMLILPDSNGALQVSSFSKNEKNLRQNRDSMIEIMEKVSNGN